MAKLEVSAKRLWGMSLLAACLSAFVGRVIGEYASQQSTLGTGSENPFGGTAGGIYGAIFGFTCGWLGARRGYGWLALLMGLAGGAAGAVLGSYLETH